MRVDGFAMMPNFTLRYRHDYLCRTEYRRRQGWTGVEKGTKDGMKLGVSVSVVLVGLILLFGRYLMQLFTKTPEVIALGTRMLFILAVGYVAMAVTQIFSGVMRGAGDTMTPMWISIITTVIIRMPLPTALRRSPVLRAERWEAARRTACSSPADLLGAGRGTHRICLPDGGKWKKKSIVKRD